MNTVKRWLAGLLSFAMIFTSAAFTNVGALNVLAFEGETDKANAAVELTIGPTTSYVDTLAHAIAEANEDDGTKKSIVIKFLKDDVRVGGAAWSHAAIETPMVLNFNGFNVTAPAVTDDNKILNHDNLCVQATASRYIYAKHETTSEYVWSFDEDASGFIDLDPIWKVTERRDICDNCGWSVSGEDGLPYTAEGVALYWNIYNDELKQYEYYEYETLAQKTDGDHMFDSQYLKSTMSAEGYVLVDGPNFVTDGTKIRHDSDGKPVVDVTVLKASDGSPVKDPDATLFDPTTAESKNNIAYNAKGAVAYEAGTYPGDQAATCVQNGMKLYGVLVKDPDGKELIKKFIVDDDIAKIAHEKGRIKRIEVLTRANIDGEVAYFDDEGELWEDAKDNERTVEKIDFVSGRYTYWFYNPVVLPAAEGDFTQPLDLTFAIAKDGSFTYRPVYACLRDAGDAKHKDVEIIGAEVVVTPMADEKTADDHQKNLDEMNKRTNPKPIMSTCTRWYYDAKAEGFDWINGQGLKKHNTLTLYNYDSQRFGLQFRIEKGDAATHIAGEISETKAPTCRDKGLGTSTCTICGDDMFDIPIPKLDVHSSKDGENFSGTVAGLTAQDIDEDLVETHTLVKDKAGSTYSTILTVEPTCTERGGEYKYCFGPEKYTEADLYSTLEDVTEDDYGDEYMVKITSAMVGLRVGYRTQGSYNANGRRLTDNDVNTEVRIILNNSDNGEQGQNRRYWRDMSITYRNDVSEDMIGHYKGEYDPDYCHWYLTKPLDALGHELSTTVTVGDGEGDSFWWNADPFAFDGVDYQFIAYQRCNREDGTLMRVTYHSAPGTDTDTNKYSAVTITVEEGGKDCVSVPKAIYTVPTLTDAKTKKPVTIEFARPGEVGPHKVSAKKFKWTEDFEKATAVGTCTICSAENVTDEATVTQTTAEDGITTFTAKHGDLTENKKAFTLKSAVVTFDASLITDAHRLDVEAPDVTVTINGTVIDPSLYTTEWIYSNQRKIAIVLVDWTEAVKKSGKAEIVHWVQAATGYADAGKLFNKIKWDYKLNGIPTTREVNLVDVDEDYDPATTYELLPIIIPDDATVKYSVVDKEIVDGKDYQKRIEALNYDKDTVVIHDAGEYYVYAQISKNGYTTYTGYVGSFVINRPNVYVQIDDAVCTVGEVPTLNKRVYDAYTHKVVDVDWADFTITTVGGKPLDKLDAGIYELNVQAPNYNIQTLADSYMGKVTVNPKEDATIAAEKVAEQLKSAQTDDELAAAYAAFAALSPEQQKIVKSDSAAAALLEKAKAAYDAKQDADKKAAEKKAAEEAANKALADANAFASDATIKALIDALNAALKQGDTAAIQKATADLNNAVAAKKAQPAKKSTPTAKISTKSKTYKAKDLKKKAKSFKIKYSKTSGSGKATFKKSSGSKKLKVSKAGKITVKKGTKKGTYKIKVKMTVAANSKFNAKTVKKTIKVKVK